jgi:riboflavin synthase
MFTGLIEARGRIEHVSRTGGSGRLRIAAPFAGELTRGESVAVNGVCLTVVRALAGAFEAEAVDRTLSTTTLGRATAGDEVNLERALRMGDRVGGHMVTGHVDGVGVVERVERTSNGSDVTVKPPTELLRHIAPRGSVALDGVSLTVAAVSEGRFTVSLIPETLSVTTAGRLRAGGVVNVETDVLAKYGESAAQAAADERLKGSAITMEKLRELGFTK